MTPLRRLISYLLRHKKSLALGGLCVAGSAIFSLTKPWIVGSAVNTLTKGVNRADLIRYGAMLVGASAIEGLFLYLQRWIIIGASRRIEYEIRTPGAPPETIRLLAGGSDEEDRRSGIRVDHAAEFSRLAGTSGLSRTMKWPAFGT